MTFTNQIAYGMMCLRLYQIYSGVDPEASPREDHITEVLGLIGAATRLKKWASGESDTFRVQEGDLEKAFLLKDSYPSEELPAVKDLNRMHEGLSALVIGGKMDPDLKQDTLQFLFDRGEGYLAYANSQL
jgi:hypothetical protein